MRISEIVVVGVTTANFYIDNALLNLLVARRLNKELSAALVGRGFSENQKIAIEKQGVHAVEFGQESIVDEVWQHVNTTSCDTSKSQKTYEKFFSHYGGVEVYLHPFVPLLMARLDFKYTLYFDSDNIAIAPFDLNALEPLESHAWVGASICSKYYYGTYSSKRAGCRLYINTGFVGYNNKLWLGQQGPKKWLNAMATKMLACASKHFCDNVSLSDQGVANQLLYDSNKNMSLHLLDHTISFSIVDWRFNALAHKMHCQDVDTTSDTAPPFFYHCTNCMLSPQCLLVSQTIRQRKLILKPPSTQDSGAIANILERFPSPISEWSKAIAPTAEANYTHSHQECGDLCRFEAYKQFNLACVDSCKKDPEFPLKIGVASSCCQ